MTDLTPRQLIDTIVRSLTETGRRMAAKYRGVAADQPARRSRVRELEGVAQGEAAAKYQGAAPDQPAPESRAPGSDIFQRERAEGERAATWGRPYNCDVLGGRRLASDQTMRDLTTRELLDTIHRSLNENSDRMAAKYKGVAPDQPAPEPRAPERQETGHKRRGKTASKSPRRS